MQRSTLSRGGLSRIKQGGKAVSSDNLQNRPGFTLCFRVPYYETDAMGVVHHANYLHWFEQGRTEYLRAFGLPYRFLEEQGIQSPVLGVRCQYKHPARYDDLISLLSFISRYNGIRLTMGYAAWKEDLLLCVGESDHAFIVNGRAVAPQRSLPEVHSVLSDRLICDQSVAFEFKNQKWL